MTAGDLPKQGFQSLKAGSKNPKEVEAYYNDWAETYNDTLKDWNYRAADDAAEALAGCVKPGGAILDVGCGTGLLAAALRDRLDCGVEGLDISAASLEIATRHGNYARLQRHDLQVTPLPLADDAFDAAACVGVMTYIEDAEALLTDLCRIVRAGGHILFTHREDRWAEEAFDALVGDMEKGGFWSPVMISEPKPYLPCNEDFSDNIGVIHALFRVKPG